MSARKHFLAGTLALAAIAGFCGPALAQQSQAAIWCDGSEAGGVSLDLQISGCTTVIRSGNKSTAILVNAFYNRGSSYHRKKEYDSAIQDYDQAIRLNPKFTRAFNNRAAAYYYKNEYDRAIQDYDQAIKLEPNHANAFYGRSFAKQRKGDKAGAEADLAAARKIDPNIGK